MMNHLMTIFGSLLAATPHAPPDGHAPDGHGAWSEKLVAAPAGSWWVLLIPLLPLLGAALVGICAAAKIRSKLPAWISIALLAISFVLTLAVYLNPQAGPYVVHGFRWLSFGWGGAYGESLTADFALYVDSLTVLWMLFVTGLGTLIAVYSSEYMSHDVGLGYCRYFAAFNLFVFSMSCLVMGDNLLLTFLGWEGVGLCSYLLIGYFYKKPAAVAAAKKAFIMNRIGDLGLVLGVLSTFVVFGTIEYGPLFDLIRAGVDGGGRPIAGTWVETVIPLLFMIGAFGKSAQLVFYVWLPDAMEGPTPVSALIHAATMVTAGVFLIARLYPMFTIDDERVALSVVAWCGAITAFWAATIEMAQFDIKRIMGYSTISQLGYMFAGLGVLTPQGAAFHVFTHAFFKATLFLCCGAVMHGFGGQLDLRRLSGVMWMKGFKITGIAMLIGSINLAGVPFTAGYFSKDMILAQAFSTPSGVITGSAWIGWLLLLTAGMTAYYTFRTFFRVFAGPRVFNPGDDDELLDLGRHPKGTTLEAWHSQTGHGHGHHGAAHDSGHHGHAHGAAPAHAGAGHESLAAPGSVAERRLQTRVDFDPTTEEFDPHPPGRAMNGVLVVLMIASILVAGTYFLGGHGGWVPAMIERSTARFEPPHEGKFLGMDPHKVMYYVSFVVGAAGIAIAWVLHLKGRTDAATAGADALLRFPLLRTLHRWANNKWYVDEFYDFLIRKPVLVGAHVFHAIDKLLVDGLVTVAGWLPRGMANAIRPSQSGLLHQYAAGMAGGVALILGLVLIVLLL